MKWSEQKQKERENLIFEKQVSIKELISRNIFQVGVLQSQLGNYGIFRKNSVKVIFTKETYSKLIWVDEKNCVAVNFSGFLHLDNEENTKNAKNAITM